jgi:hypothetical protein
VLFKAGAQLVEKAAQSIGLGLDVVEMVHDPGRDPLPDPREETPAAWINPRVMEYMNTTPSRLFLRHLGRLLASAGVSLRAWWRG